MRLFPGQMISCWSIVVPILRWLVHVPPHTGVYKLNSDPAVNLKYGKVGLGVIIRNFKGQVMACKASLVLVGFSPLISEALAILSGRRFTLEVGLFPCVIEFDSQVTVNLMHSGSDRFADVGLVLNDIRLLLSSVSDELMEFVPKKANMAAHGLAKFALSLFSDRILLEGFPLFLAFVVLGDCLL
ncbi:hypothetical protein Dsin_009740 [Dipteronia sinensis]|uniref:RNase H type-1 domain-containing protein n=1 Tax=Dipteronia sinensis TaxID=43782 RepID=A0AAE0EDR8_9ROSI|nr:hypothetical protein Dsin_009740 [Dipteronia sinensis]